LRRRSPLLTTAVVLCGLATAASAATPGSTKAPLWGVAGGYTREQLKDLSRRGTSLVLLELSWSKAELGKGVWDEHYFAAARARAAFMRSLGLKVVLNLGIHNAPDWLLALPNARFVNQAGEPYLASDEPNLVFGKELRRYAEQYIQKVFEELGQNYFAVRVGGGHWGELQYPAQKSATGSWDWWAFDKNALAQSPVPRYRPCVGAQPGVNVPRLVPRPVELLPELAGGRRSALVPGQDRCPLRILGDAAWRSPQGGVRKSVRHLLRREKR
jgi:hypothetical protein